MGTVARLVRAVVCAVALACALHCPSALASRHSTTRGTRPMGDISVRDRTVVQHSLMKNPFESNQQTWPSEDISDAAEGLGAVPVARETRLKGVPDASRPYIWDTDAASKMRLREAGEGAGADSPPQRLSFTRRVRTTRNVEEFYDNSTRKRHIWTPDRRFPEAGSDIARAVHLAHNSFIVADCAAEATHLHVFYRKPGSSSASPLAAAIDNGEDAEEKGMESSDRSYRARCTGSENTLRGISTALRRVALEGNPVTKVELSRAILAALYSTCKETIIKELQRKTPTEAEKSDLPHEIAEAAGLLRPTPNASTQRWGILKDLKPSEGSKLSERLMVETWFNNVNIYYEGTGALRSAAVLLSQAKLGSLEDNLWMYVENADALIRHNEAHIFTRVLTGAWQGFYGFLSAMQWAAQWNSLYASQAKQDAEQQEGQQDANEYHHITNQNTLVVWIGEESTQLVVRTGPTEVEGLGEQLPVDTERFAQKEAYEQYYGGVRQYYAGADEWSKAMGEMVLVPQGGSSAPPPPARSRSTSLLEVGASARGTSKRRRRRKDDPASFWRTAQSGGKHAPVMSLLYPLIDNPGTLASESLLGAGENRLLKNAMRLAYRREGRLVTGRGAANARRGQIEMPCLSKGVRVGEYSGLDPTFPTSLASKVCFRNVGKGAVPFSFRPCLSFSLSKMLVQAVTRDEVSWLGTSDTESCSDLVRECLDEYDDHVIPEPMLKQFEELTNDDDGPLRKDKRKDIKHVIISNRVLLRWLSQYLQDEAVDLPDTVLTEGLTIPQAEAFFKALGSKKMGGRGLDKLEPTDYHMPLMASFVKVVLEERLGFNAKWRGRVHFVDLSWTSGAEALLGPIDFLDDVNYRNRYESERFRTPSERMLTKLQAEDPEKAQREDPEYKTHADNVDNVASRRPAVSIAVAQRELTGSKRES